MISKETESNKQKLKTPWGPIGYITYKRTYARKKDDNDPNSPTEELKDTIERVITSCRNQLNVGFTEAEEDELRQIMLNLKGLPAGRFLWQLGTKTVDKLGLLSLQNCAFTNVDDPIKPFIWAMEAHMLGVGVGYNIQKKNVYQIPKVLNSKIDIIRLDTKDADFIVPDTREGWVKLLGKTLKAHFFGGKGFTYSTQLIRGKGAPITTFGGIAAGAEELCWGIAEINKLLNSKAGKKLDPIDCLDIINIIGYVIVAGNVRRAAQIMLGDADDIDFLKAKRWDLGSVPKWRSMSNNSVICNDTSLLSDLFWDTYKQGEPYGIINIDLSKKIGRLGDFNYPDPDVEGYNPCAEQSLAQYETCCLAETFLPNITSLEEFKKVITYLYRINKHSLALKCHLKKTEEIVHKHMRMGIGITGVWQASKEQLSWLPTAYEYLREYDRMYSAEHNFPISIKLTTSKPSGTLSLLAGVTPGSNVSPAGPYFIRRLWISSNSPLIELCKKNGYEMNYSINIDGSIDHNTMVVEFPCSVPEHTPIAANVSAIDQLEMIKYIQTAWSDNSVSVTVTYKMSELEEIKQWLRENYTDSVKSVSFLLYSEHGFKQPPFETISKERYDELISKTKKIENVEVSEDTFDLDECSTGACPVK